MKKISLFFIFMSIVSNAQVGGENIYPFLNFSTSPRQTALGGDVLTFANDVNQPIWNPATLNKNMDRSLSLNYVNYLLEINYLSSVFAYSFNERIGTLHAGLTYANYGTFIGADEMGVETGTFKSYDMAFSVGYAYQIPKSNFNVGINAKLINSVIEKYKSLGLAADIGIFYYNEEKPYRFALVVRNVGTQLKTYDGTKESLPFELKIGGSYQLEHVPIRLYGTLDNLQQWQLAYSNPSDSTTDFDGIVTQKEPTGIDNAFRHLVFGAELFPEKGFSLRFGYNYQRAMELSLNQKRTFAGISLGFGLRFNKLKINYSFSKYHPVADSHSLGLNYKLD